MITQQDAETAIRDLSTFMVERVKLDHPAHKEWERARAWIYEAIRNLPEGSVTDEWKGNA